MKNISKILGFIFIISFLFLPLNGEAKIKAPKKECHSYVVMDAGSGQVLFGQDEDKMIYPASTAKLMTAIVCLENGDVNSKIKTKYDIVYGTTLGTYALGIGANVTYTFKDLLAMSLISSASDATDSLAVAVFGSKKKCAEAMNAKCKELGLENTSFDNPVGSDIGAGFTETYATAREMAIITRYAMTKPLIRELVAKSSYSAKGITANTTNWFIRGMSWYDQSKYKIIGSKSGTTNAAGNVFIATAMDKEGHEVICAYFGNVSKESTFKSIRELYDYTFKQYKKGNIELSPSNYDVRCSESIGDIYEKYASLNCYPGEKNGKFYSNRSANRAQIGRMLRSINGLSKNKTLTAFITDNRKGSVTSSKLAMLIQKIYPQHLSNQEVSEILSECSGTENLSDAEKEAFAVLVKENVYPDELCKNAKQIITRKQALLFADRLRDYQEKYMLTHCNPDAESEEARDDHLYGGIRIVGEEWMQKIVEFHANKESEPKEVAEEATTEAE